MTFSARFVLSIIRFAGVQGANAKKLLELTGYSMEALCDEALRVDSEVYNQVLEQAIAATGDDCFGLHSGEYLNLSAAGLIGQITQTSATVKEALEYCCEFAQLGCRALPMALKEEEQYFRLLIKPDTIWLQQSELSVRHTIDGVLAFTIREFHTLTFQKYYPVAINYAFGQPKNTDEYERVFQCPFRFNQKETSILFDKNTINQPVVTSDYQLLRILVEHAEEKIAIIENEEGFAHLVKQSMINLIKPEFPTIDQVAGNLNISVRTLQRRLKEEGVTFKEILESLRRDFAISYLRKSELSINEIAYLLSYADASAFIRSFKRWTGKTPQVYRT